LATNVVLALLYGLMNFFNIYILYRCHPEKGSSDGSEMVVGHNAACSWEPLNYVDLTCAPCCLHLNDNNHLHCDYLLELGRYHVSPCHIWSIFIAIYLL